MDWNWQKISGGVYMTLGLLATLCFLFVVIVSGTGFWYLLFGLGIAAFGAMLYFADEGYRVRSRRDDGDPPEEADLIEAARASLLAMFVATTADGEIDDEQIGTMTRIFNGIFDVEMEETFIRETAEHFIDYDIDLYGQLEDCSQFLSDDERRGAFQCAWYAAASKREIKDEEEAALFEIADALGMDEEDLRACVETFAAMVEGATTATAKD